MENKNTDGSNTSRTKLYKTDISSLSRPAKQRLKWMDHFSKYRNARLTCRHFGISPDTFYLWKKRYAPNNLMTLEDDLKTRKPHKVRVSKHLTEQLKTVSSLKSLDPRLGKIKITRILMETGYKISSSTVSRLLTKMHIRGGTREKVSDSADLERSRMGSTGGNESSDRTPSRRKK